MVEQVVVVVVVVVAAVAVVEVVVLFVGWPAVTVGTAVHRVLACSAAVRCSAPGWGASAVPSDAGCPSAVADGVVPNVVYSAVTGSPN